MDEENWVFLIAMTVLLYIVFMSLIFTIDVMVRHAEIIIQYLGG